MHGGRLIFWKATSSRYMNPSHHTTITTSASYSNSDHRIATEDTMQQTDRDLPACFRVLLTLCPLQLAATLAHPNTRRNHILLCTINA